MTAYINQLNAAVEAQRVQRNIRLEEKARVEATAARERLTPLEDRLERLLATIPIELQREGLSLSTLQASLRGRWRGNAHPGEVARGLRTLGFHRIRRWSGDAGFRAIWRRAT
jgi:hypothetical protein